ncbi:MAG: hypothetical protein WD492_09215 [Alkalispirochaeta sp.]
MKHRVWRRAVAALVLAILVVPMLAAQSGASGRGRSRGPSTGEVTVLVPDQIINRGTSNPLGEIRVFVSNEQMSGLTFKLPAGRHTVDVRTGGLRGGVSLEVVAGEQHTIVPSFQLNISQGRVSQPAQTSPVPEPAPTPQRSPETDRNQNQGNNAASAQTDDQGSSAGRFGPLRYGWYEIKPGMVGMAADYEYLRFSPDGSVMYRSGTNPQPQQNGYYEWDGEILTHYDSPNDNYPREWRRIGPTEFESTESGPNFGPDRLEFE